MSADSPVRAVVPMPTGSGKTRVTVEAMMEKAQSSGPACVRSGSLTGRNYVGRH